MRWEQVVLKRSKNKMGKHTTSSDGVLIHYQISGENFDTTLLFVHGWLGNSNWWINQSQFFSKQFNVVQIDLGGHGKSDKLRENWTAQQYADDIKSVVGQLNCKNVILIGHSMSGAFVLLASIGLPTIKSIVLIDTLHDLDQFMDHQHQGDLMFSYYRKDFKFAVENILPQYLFVEDTPITIIQQLQTEFLENDSEFAINALKPLYGMDVLETAKKVNIPVRSINSNTQSTQLGNNRKYFNDYDFSIIKDTGHYPMLEKPEEFNEVLKRVLCKLKQKSVYSINENS